MGRYVVNLSDGREVTLEADQEPTEADVISAIGDQPATDTREDDLRNSLGSLGQPIPHDSMERAAQNFQIEKDAPQRLFLERYRGKINTPEDVQRLEKVWQRQNEQPLPTPGILGATGYAVASPFTYAGRVLASIPADVAEDVHGEGGNPIKNLVTAISTPHELDKPLPIEEKLQLAREDESQRGQFGGASILGNVSLGVAKTLPKIAAIALAPESLPWQMGTAGGLFGLHEDGSFSVKDAAIGALMPGIGSATRKVVGETIGKAITSGDQIISHPLAQKAIETVAEQSALNAFTLAAQSPELIQLYHENPEEFWKHVTETVGQNIAFGFLGASKMGKDVPSETQKWFDSQADAQVAKLKAAPPEALKQLGIRMPDFNNAINTPELEGLASRAIAEHTRQKLLAPNEVPAIDLLRRQGEQIIQTPSGSRVADRPEGVEGGRISFNSPAEGYSIPSARQSEITPVAGRVLKETVNEPPIEPAPKAEAEPLKDLAQEIGFTFDGVQDWGNGKLLAFTRREGSPSDPAYGATFYAPEGTSPSVIKAMGEKKLAAFREGAKPVEPVIKARNSDLTPEQLAKSKAANDEMARQFAAQLGVKPKASEPAPQEQNKVIPASPETKAPAGEAASDLTIEGVTGLDPQSGSPLSALEGLINRTEAKKPGLLQTIDDHLSGLQTQLRSGKQSFTGVTGLEPVMLDAAITAARGAIKLTGSVIDGTKAAIEHIKKNFPDAKFNPDELSDWVADKVRTGAGIPAPQAATGTPAPGAPAIPQAGAPAAAPAAPGAPAVNPAPAGGPAVALDDVYKIFEPAPKTSPTLKERVVNIIEGVRTGVSSKFRPVDKLAEDIGKAYGVQTPKGIAAIMEQLKGSTGKGEADVHRFDKSVSDLVKGNEKDFSPYMFLRRSIDRLEEDAKDPANARRKVANYDLPQLKAKLAQLESNLGPKLPAFQKAADEYQAAMDNALQLQVSSGRMSPQVYQAIKDGNQFYAPFKVMKYLEETSRAPGTGTRVDTTAEFTKKMQGIEDQDFKLGDMLGAARQNILLSRILADKNSAMRNVADLAAFDTAGNFIKKLKPDEDAPKDMEAVNVFEGGDHNRYAVNKDVASALQLYSGNAGSIISKTLRAFAVPFRAGATALNLPFQVSNLLADVPRAALVSKYGVRNVADLVNYPLDFIQSVYSSFTGDVLGHRNKLFMDFLDSGAAQSTVQSYLTPDGLKFKPESIPKKLAHTILYTIPNFANAIEQTSKIMGIKRAMRFEGVTSGKQLADQIPQAVTEIRRFSGSPDFGRQGSWVENARLNLLFMFLNARIQGATADVGRLGGRDGAGTAVKTWAKILTAVGVPTMYLYLLNHDKDHADDYAQRPTQEKQNYWLIPKSTYITNENGEKMRDYWRIPKRESAKWVGNLVESALGFGQKNDPQNFGKFAQSMIEDISPVNIQGNTFQERMESMGASLNPVLKAPLEAATGRDMYRHRDTIPDSMKKASPENQYTDQTADVFKKLADKMPDIAPEIFRSPIMLESMTRNLTAGLITQFLPKKPVEGRGNVENAPLLQRFQALPYTDQTKFKDEMEKLQREAADAQLNRHRTSVKFLQDNKGVPARDMLEDAAKKFGNDRLQLQQIVDLFIAEKNGVSNQERQVLALPANERAKYIQGQLEGKSVQERQDLLRNFAKKRILTETVAEAMLKPQP